MEKVLEDILSNGTISKSIEMAKSIGKKGENDYSFKIDNCEIYFNDKNKYLQIKFNDSYIEFNRTDYKPEEVIKFNGIFFGVGHYDKQYTKIIDEINRIYDVFAKSKYLFVKNNKKL